MKITALPLRDAYPFATSKGLNAEVEAIRNMPISWNRSMTSSVRRGAVLALFQSKGIFDEFVSTHWPEGTSARAQTRIRWYLKVWDEYQAYLAGEGSSATAETESEDEEQSFAYEEDLRDYLAKNPSVIEKGLRLYVDGEREGVEYPVGDKRVDILALDQTGGFVVIELKVSRGHERTIGQLLYYMGWVQEHLAKGKPVRGVIVAKDVSEELRLASRWTPQITLYEYDLQVTLRRI